MIRRNRRAKARDQANFEWASMWSASLLGLSVLLRSTETRLRLMYDGKIHWRPSIQFSAAFFSTRIILAYYGTLLHSSTLRHRAVICVTWTSTLLYMRRQPGLLSNHEPHRMRYNAKRRLPLRDRRRRPPRRPIHHRRPHRLAHLHLHLSRRNAF
ncbi:hypothetical protein FB45DRAFT_395475 [Roridomyces roridus]|uniref:Uncharacterized protein n=1 Tax=Roridomyces roridus TaxID=1738132 RepID=A0AAD7B2G8_9AGAR|nr:hypothetical protein FB45DRAFT_395475 [Roridomyces roridus]